MSDTNSLTGNMHNETSSGRLQVYNHSLLPEYNKIYARALLPVIIYIVFMIVLGTVGNSVALVVYYKRFKPSSTRTFIMSLSAISLLASLVCFPEKIAEYCLHFTFTNRSACQVFSFLRGFTTYSMALIHITMAFDRQRRVCSPSVRQWKMQDVNIAVGLCVALSVFIGIPMFVLYGSRTVDWTSNVTGVMCGEDDSYVGSTGLLFYYVLLTGVFVVGMVVIVISYVKVGLKVWEHKKQLQKRYLGTSSCRHQARLTRDADVSRESFQVPAMSQLEVTRTDNNITHGDRCSTSCDLDCTGRNLTSFEINSTFSCGDRAECHVTGKLYDVTSFELGAPNPSRDCLKLVTFTPPSVAHLECPRATESSDLAIPVLSEAHDVDTGGSNMEADTSPQVDTCHQFVILSVFPVGEAHEPDVPLCPASATDSKESHERTREVLGESRTGLSSQDVDTIEASVETAESVVDITEITVDKSDFTVTTCESNIQTVETVHRTDSTVTTPQSTTQTTEPTVATIESDIATCESCLTTTENNVVVVQPNTTTEPTSSSSEPVVETDEHTLAPRTPGNIGGSVTDTAEPHVTTRSSATGQPHCFLSHLNTNAKVTGVSLPDVRRTGEPTVKIQTAADVSRSTSVPVFLLPGIMSRELREVTKTGSDLASIPSFVDDRMTPSDRACDSLDESMERFRRSHTLYRDTPLTPMTSILAPVLGTKPCTTAPDIQPTNPASHATVTSQYVGVGLEEMSEGGCEEISLHPEVNRGEAGCIPCPGCCQAGLGTLLCCILGRMKSLTKPSRDRRHDRRIPAKRIPSRTTVTLVVMSGIFILSYLPTLVILVLRSIAGLSEKSMSTAMLNLIQFCLLSHYINFTIGPIVYSVCSVRFRQQLCYFLSGLCKKRKLREELSLKL